MVGETSRTLLEQIKSSPDHERWEELVNIYSPFIRSIAIRCGATGVDAEDVVQNVLTVVVRKLGDFDRKRTGSFRSWLRAVTVNAIRETWRPDPLSEACEVIQDLEDPNSELTRYWNEEHDRHVMKRLIERVRPEFRENTWKAFQLVAIERRTADEVADELGITSNAVFISRSRVMKRLREIGAEILQ